MVVSGAFEWNSDKAEANLRKHGVSFDEAATVFFDLAAVYLEDPKYDGREWVIGFSAAGRMLLVVHVERGERTRIISARNGGGYAAAG